MEKVLDKPQVNTEELISLYKSNYSRYECLEEEVKHILDAALKKKGIKIHSITSRIKELKSLLDKVDRKSFSGLEEVNDIVGTRVVCLFLDDINFIGDCIRESFEVLEEDNKIEDTEVSAFGYMSFHFIAKIKDEYNGPRYDSLKGLVFEVQVRTISMDAWANISHYLDYKTEEDLPIDLKKDFHALSGLFYVADKHFQMFVQSSEVSKAEKLEVVQTLLNGDAVHLKDDLINSDTLSALLNEKYPNRMSGDAKRISDLIEELNSIDITKISELVSILDKCEEAFKIYESDNPPGAVGNDEPQIYAAIGVVRLSLALFFEEYRNKHPFKKDSLAQKKYQDLIKK